MAFLVSIGGMRLRHWTGFFRIIGPTLRLRVRAGRTPGCVHVDTFRAGGYFFALSVWTDAGAMRGFAHAGDHVALMPRAGDTMAYFHNHSYCAEAIPSRDQAVAAWQRARPA